MDDPRLRRLHMRSHRRGMRETDLILGDFARSSLPALSPAELDLYEALLEEPDADILLWVTGAAPPSRFAPLVERIRAGAVGLGDAGPDDARSGHARSGDARLGDA